MKTLMLIAALVAADLPAQGASLPDPIAPAAKGQLECYQPDTARKTCVVLARYKFGEDGTITNIGEALISKRPAATMLVRSTVEIKAGKVCGKLRKQDLDAAKIRLGGHVLDEKDTAPLKEQLHIIYEGIIDHEMCTSYLDEGGIRLAKSSVDGVPLPAATDRRVLWVSPSEGYIVSP